MPASKPAAPAAAATSDKAREEHRALRISAITDFDDAPLADIADQCIYVATGSASYVDSPTVVAAVLHVLATLTTASAKGARRRLGERYRLNTELGLYVID